ncbi:hypothetical protein BDF20DRAFT_814265 [Mycotypha africana]|uniref:uncharacterized protein n=1 Tax=Mycotypha africana TaxID=64632 RepID=UPI0023012F1F|nr:uncharacterized protein BDF20DRAFT_814265 [Mycotypha africana]KAI8987419.1 hypothetical protein BDF20DRAFT_814265 [Mycotypha africana]
MQLVRSIFSITAVALTSASAFILSDGIAVVHGNLSVQAVNDNHRYASSYLEPFAPEDAVEKPFELVDDHEDLVTNAKGHLVSLRKRGDDCQKYHKVKSSDNCISVAKAHNLTLAQFYDLNPSVNRGSCDNLLTGRFYCIRGESKKSIAEKIVEKTTRKKAAEEKAMDKKEEEANKKDSRRLLQKGSDFTYYWIAHPEDYDDSGKSITIRTCEGKSLGSVPESYADALVMEGTGVIGDKVINLGGCSCSNYKCFMEVDKKEDPFGLTSFGTPLRPFITIAANDIKRNTKVYIPQLVGWEIPGSSKKHNGCLLIDDQSWSFTDNHIDFYVYREKNYHTLNNEHKINSVDIYEGGDCNLLNYL